MLQNDKLLFLKINDLLSDNPSISLFELARIVGVDRHKLQQHIHEFTNKTFREYQKGKKILRVIKILGEKEDIRVKEIASLLKYRSPKAFSRFIKNTTGRTTKHLR